jgi:hypothetical protein
MRRRWLGVATLAVALACDTGPGGTAPTPSTTAVGAAAPDDFPVVSPPAVPVSTPTATATPPPADPSTPSSTVAPAAPGTLTWAAPRLIGAAFDQDDGDFVVPLASGGVLVAGNGLGSFEPHLPSDVTYRHGFLAWLDATGALVRARDVGVETGATIDGFAVSPEGDIAIGGWRGATGGSFIELRDANGDPLWLVDLSSPEGAVAPYGVAFAPDGDLVVAGTSYPPPDPANPTARGAWVARYDATGQRRWLRVLGHDPLGYARAPTLSPDGSIVVVGRAGGSFVARLSASGELAWLRPLSTLHYAGPDDVAVDAHGDAYVAGTTLDLDAYLARVDPSGEVVWVRTISTSGIDTGRGVVALRSGGVVLVGKLGGESGGFASGGSRPFAARFTLDGDRTWLTEIPTSSGGFASGAALEPDDGVLVVGSADEPGGGSFSRDAFVARVDARGVIR